MIQVNVLSLRALRIVLLFAFAVFSLKANGSRPNILFILSDDHTTQAISCYDGLFADQANTVHIDKLAREGMRFTKAFCTNSICSPSRATILTGKYSHKNGVYILGQEFDGTQTTSNQVLGKAGYQTAVFGKWHLKSEPYGFDDYKVLQKQGRYQDPEFVVKGQDALVTYEGWSTDVITEMTTDYIKNRDPESRFLSCANISLRTIPGMPARLMIPLSRMWTFHCRRISTTPMKTGVWRANERL